MARTAKIAVGDHDIVKSLQDFFRSALETNLVSAVFVPQKLPMKNRVMPMLATRPDQLVNADPLAPVFPLNAGRMAARLTRKPAGGKILMVLRSCEMRAFVELVKLKQARVEDVILMGIDCLGAFQNRDYFEIVAENSFETTRRHVDSALAGKPTAVNGRDIAPACRACEYPIPENADVLVGLYGVDTQDHLLVQSQSDSGDLLLAALDLAPVDAPAGREQAVEALVKTRKAFRDAMFDKTREAVNDLEKMTAYFADCVNCYNCRVACPVCYCRECVFYTDVFDHDPSQYLQWSRAKGVIKLPTDTSFYHLTRLAHMSTACVGCGQCSNACPNDIRVMEVFRTVSYRTQKAFEYLAGRSLDEKPPLSEFREREFEEVVGIGP